MRHISKDIFLQAINCGTFGWMLRTGQFSEPPTLGGLFRMEQGKEVAQRALSLYPKGVMVSSLNALHAARQTEELMKDPAVKTIFEAAFALDGYVTRADILERTDSGWHVKEIKSSVNDKPDFIDDMAYTVMVMLKCGQKIDKVSLVLLSREYIYGMDNDKLFVEIDHTEHVMKRAKEFLSLWDIINTITGMPDKPAAELKLLCKDCAVFKNCMGAGVPNHIFDIPRLSAKKFDQIYGHGICRIEDITDSFELSDMQSIVKKSVQLGKPVIGDDLKDALSAVVWPAYYLDFETVMTALPLYPGLGPYCTIPTQFSVHKCSAPGVIDAHFEFLSDHSKDGRRDFAETLINTLQGAGSIVVYSGFEKTTINGLAKLYPDLAPLLQALVSRIIDLEAIIKANYYHPGFHGKTSIKKVLPVMVPDMNYSGLEIQNGDTAMVTFASMALGKYNPAEAVQMRKHLLEYCKQDTLAMVKLHESLAKIAALQ